MGKCFECKYFTFGECGEFGECSFFESEENYANECDNFQKDEEE